MNDPVSQLEHDHTQLNRLVDGLRDSIQACLREDTGYDDLRDDLRDFLRVAQEELMEHFDLEETGLFPYLLSVAPETAELIDSLEVGHDRMCGLLTRMERMLEGPEDPSEAAFDALITLFARFDAVYVTHARKEGGLLRSLAERLTASERDEISRLLSGL